MSEKTGRRQWLRVFFSDIRSWSVKRTLDWFWSNRSFLVAITTAVAAILARFWNWTKTLPLHNLTALILGVVALFFTILGLVQRHRKRVKPDQDARAPVVGTEMFQLLMAAWGADPPKTDVTQIVQGIISTGKSSIEATTKVFGDPAYGHKKTLSVTYSDGRAMYTIIIPEGETRDLPIRGRTIIPPQHTPIRPPNPDQLLQVSVSRRKRTRDDGGADYYSCEVSVKNMSTVVLQNVGVKMTSWNPVPADPHKGTTEGTIDKQTRIPLPMPVDFPIAIKPESQAGRTINPGDSSIFRLFKMIRTGANQWGEGIATVEIVGAERQYHWFRPPKWCTVELECSSSVGAVRRQYQITFEADEKKIASFTII